MACGNSRWDVGTVGGWKQFRVVKTVERLFEQWGIVGTGTVEMLIGNTECVYIGDISSELKALLQSSLAVFKVGVCGTQGLRTDDCANVD